MAEVMDNMMIPGAWSGLTPFVSHAESIKAGKTDQLVLPPESIRPLVQQISHLITYQAKPEAVQEGRVLVNSNPIVVFLEDADLNRPVMVVEDEIVFTRMLGDSPADASMITRSTLASDENGKLYHAKEYTKRGKTIGDSTVLITSGANRTIRRTYAKNPDTDFALAVHHNLCEQGIEVDLFAIRFSVGLDGLRVSY